MIVYLSLFPCLSVIDGIRGEAVNRDKRTNARNGPGNLHVPLSQTRKGNVGRVPFIRVAWSSSNCLARDKKLICVRSLVRRRDGLERVRDEDKRRSLSYAFRTRCGSRRGSYSDLKLVLQIYRSGRSSSSSSSSRISLFLYPSRSITFPSPFFQLSTSFF